MRTTRMMIAGAVALAVMLAPGAATAQSADTEDLPLPAHWSGSVTSGPRFAVPGTEAELFPWGNRTTVGLTYTNESDDPRATGDLAIVFTVDWSGGNQMGRGTGLARLVNQGGSFEGPLNVIYYPDGSEFRMALMDGKDGFEGLTYSMTNYLDPLGRGQSQGLIWEGEMPPIPDAEALPD